MMRTVVEIRNVTHKYKGAGEESSAHDPELLEQCCDYELCIRKGRVAYFRTITTKECSDV